MATVSISTAWSGTVYVGLVLFNVCFFAPLRAAVVPHQVYPYGRFCLFLLPIRQK